MSLGRRSAIGIALAALLSPRPKLALPLPVLQESVPDSEPIARTYYQIEWPLSVRRYEVGVYTDEVMAHYFEVNKWM